MTRVRCCWTAKRGHFPVLVSLARYSPTQAANIPNTGATRLLLRPHLLNLHRHFTGGPSPPPPSSPPLPAPSQQRTQPTTITPVEQLQPTYHNLYGPQKEARNEQESVHQRGNAGGWWKWRGWLDSMVSYYEESIGISEVQMARKEVTQCEARLQQAQQQRRAKHLELQRLHSRLKEIHSQLDRTNRSEDAYLQLLTEEHNGIKCEAALTAEHEALELRERNAFEQLSNKVRASHEREREREERTKYWSLTASLVGALLGIVGTSVGNELRMRHLREMLPTNQQIAPVLRQLTDAIANNNKQTSDIVRRLDELGGRIPAGKSDKTVRGGGGGQPPAPLNADDAREQAELASQHEKGSANESKGGVGIEGGSEFVLAKILHSEEEMELESALRLQAMLCTALVYSSLAIVSLLFRGGG